MPFPLPVIQNPRIPIFIPSRARAHLQHTVRRLTEQGVVNPITIVVPAPEVEDYRQHESDQVKILGRPDGYALSETRKWICEISYQKGVDQIIQMDDDLRFLTRIDRDDPTLGALQQSQPGQAQEIVDWIQQNLERGYAHVSLSTRLGNNYIPVFEKEVSRPYRVYAFNTRIVAEEGIRFHPEGFDGRFTMDDFYSCVQLLDLGYPNIVAYIYATDQPNSNTEGGASIHRTIESHNRCAETLGGLYPELVRVVTKHTKLSWGGQERKDVRIQWQLIFNRRFRERKSVYGQQMLERLCSVYGIEMDQYGRYPF